MYVINDFGREEYLDGVLCRYSVEDGDDIAAYVFNRETADLLAKVLNERIIIS